MTTQTSVSPLGTEAHADTRAVLLNQVSWGAIFAGATIALVSQAVINLIGVGVGLASVGVNAFDGQLQHTLDDVREAMSIDPAVPMVVCDARHRQSTKETLIALVQHAMHQRMAAGAR